MASVVVETKIKRSKQAQKHVIERTSNHLCVACDEKECQPKPYRRRGLCTTCEGRWTTARNNMPTEQLKYDLDQKLMEEGKLLGEGEIIRLNKRSVFDEIAELVTGTK